GGGGAGGARPGGRRPAPPARRWIPDRRGEPRLERGGGREAGQVRAGGLAQRAQLGELGAAGGAIAQVGFELERRAHVELVVEVGSEERTRLGAVHGVSPAERSARWSCVRARDKRDITVPMGTPATSAISR